MKIIPAFLLLALAAPSVRAAEPAVRDSGKTVAKPALAYRHHALAERQIGFYAVYLPKHFRADSAQGKKYPLCVILHGSGSTETGHGSLAIPYASEDIIFVAPRAPYPSYEVFIGSHEEGWAAWPEYPSEWGGFEGKDFPHQEFERLDPAQLYADWIADCIHDMRRRYPISGEKAVVIGHSEGGAFAHIASARHPELIKAYAAYAGYYPFLEGDSAAKGLRSGKVFSEVIHCEADSQVSVSEGRKLIKYLEDNKLPHTGLIFTGGSHQLGSRPTAALREFIYKWCLNRKPPPLKGMLVVNEVVPASRADSLGLAAGDRLTSYGGAKVATMDEYYAARESATGKKTVILEVLRGSSILKFTTVPGTLGVHLEER